MKLKSHLRHLFCIFFLSCLAWHFDPAASHAATVLFVSDNEGTYTNQEQLRVDVIASWGHTVVPVWERASQAEFAAAAAQADVVYFSSEANHSVYSDYNVCSGVVLETPSLVTNLGFSSSAGSTSTLTTLITGVPHDITSGYLIGNVPIFTASNRVTFLNGTVSPAVTRLAYDPSSNGTSLGTLEIGDALYPSGTAAGRRVWLPWGIGNMLFNEVSPDGLVFMQRAIDWAAETSTCARLYKRAFLSDGTPVADSSNLPVGTRVHFLLYMNNPSAPPLNDVNIVDPLDPLFAYTPVASGGMLKVDNSLAPGASEAAIYAAVSATANLTEDAVDGSLVAGYTPGTLTISAGSSAGNATLNIAPNSVWAMLFEVTLQP